MLCCNEGQWLSLRECMRAANGTKLASAEYCWNANRFLPHPYEDPDPTTTTYRRSSIPSDNSYQSYSYYTNSEEEDDDRGSSLGGVLIWVVFAVFLIALKQYRRLVRTQRTYQELEEEEEEEEPLTAHIPSDSDPVPTQNTKYVV